MRFANACLGHRLFAVGCTDPVERAMCGSHVATGLMTGERNLLRRCAHRFCKDFDGAVQAPFTESKTDELEQQPQIQGRRGRLDLLVMQGRTFQME